MSAFFCCRHFLICWLVRSCGIIRTFAFSTAYCGLKYSPRLPRLDFRSRDFFFKFFVSDRSCIFVPSFQCIFVDMNWRSTRRMSPPAGSVAVVGHITDQRQTFAERSALFIQRGVERLAGGEVHLSVKLPSGDIKVWTRSDSQVQRMLAAVTFSVPSAQSGGQEDIPVHFTLARTQKIQGLVYALHASDEPESELAAALVSQGVSAVRRLPPRGRHSDGALLVLTFEGPARPDHVVLLYQRLEVRPFVPYPLRCGKCQRYRHHARFCRLPVRCGRCAGPHLTEGCTAEALKCAACGEGHTVRDSACSVWRTELVMNRWMAVDGLTLAEARQRVSVPYPAHGRTAAGGIGGSIGQVSAATGGMPSGVEVPRATRGGQVADEEGASLTGLTQCTPPQTARDSPSPVLNRRTEISSESPLSAGSFSGAGMMYQGKKAESPTSSARRAPGSVEGVGAGQSSPASSLGQAVSLAGPTLRSPRRRLEPDVLEGWQVAVGRNRGPVPTYNRWTLLEAEDQTQSPTQPTTVSVGCQTSQQPRMDRVDSSTQTDSPSQTEAGSQWKEQLDIPSHQEIQGGNLSSSNLSLATCGPETPSSPASSGALPSATPCQSSPELPFPPNSCSPSSSVRVSRSPKSPDQLDSRRPRTPSPYPHGPLRSPHWTRSSRRGRGGK